MQPQRHMRASTSPARTKRLPTHTDLQLIRLWLWVYHILGDGFPINLLFISLSFGHGSYPQPIFLAMYFHILSICGPRQRFRPGVGAVHSRCAFSKSGVGTHIYPHSWTEQLAVNNAGPSNTFYFQEHSCWFLHAFPNQKGNVWLECSNGMPGLPLSWVPTTFTKRWWLRAARACKIQVTISQQYLIPVHCSCSRRRGPMNRFPTQNPFLQPFVPRQAQV